MNDYEKLCKQLEEDEKNGCLSMDNEYVCAYDLLKKKVDNDGKMLLKIKGESISSDYWAYLSNLNAIVAILVTVSTLLFTVVEKIMGEQKFAIAIYGLIIFIALVMYTCLYYKKVNKYFGVSKWGGYVKAALEQIEKEMQLVDENISKDEKKKYKESSDRKKQKKSSKS